MSGWAEPLQMQLRTAVDIGGAQIQFRSADGGIEWVDALATRGAGWAALARLLVTVRTVEPDHDVELIDGEEGWFWRCSCGAGAGGPTRDFASTAADAFHHNRNATVRLDAESRP